MVFRHVLLLLFSTFSEKCNFSVDCGGGDYYLCLCGCVVNTTATAHVRCGFFFPPLISFAVWYSEDCYVAYCRKSDEFHLVTNVSLCGCVVNSTATVLFPMWNHRAKGINSARMTSHMLKGTIQKHGPESPELTLIWHASNTCVCVCVNCIVCHFVFAC